MRETGAIGGKGLMVLICSLLMVFQPLFGAPASSTTGTVSGSEQIELNGVPATAGTKVDAMLIATLLFSHPEPSAATELIAVAKLTGTAERNGLPLLNGSIVSSGDSLSTREDSALLLSSAPQERLWLGPNTSARVTKDADNVAVALERGTLGFETRGRIQVTFKSHDGLAIRSRPASPVLAQLSFLNDQDARVWLQEGSLELVQGGQSVVLKPERSDLISVAGTRPSAEPRTREDSGAQAGSSTQASSRGSIKGKVLTTESFVVSGAIVTLAKAAGAPLTTVTDREGNFTFSDVPAGSYTLHVVQPGFPTYEMRDVVVSNGRESSLYIEMGRGGKKSNGLILGVIAGGAAAGGIGAWLATKGGKTTVSPSSTH